MFGCPNMLNQQCHPLTNMRMRTTHLATELAFETEENLQNFRDQESPRQCQENLPGTSLVINSPTCIPIYSAPHIIYTFFRNHTLFFTSGNEDTGRRAEIDERVGQSDDKRLKASRVPTNRSKLQIATRQICSHNNRRQYKRSLLYSTTQLEDKARERRTDR